MRWLTVHGAQLHNLQNVTATVPLHRLVAQGSVADITGAEDSQTGRYLLHAMKHPLQLRRSMARG